MTHEILVNVTSQETRIAVVENGMLQEIMIERHRKRGLISNIYLGRVSRVLPGMQAAFIEIGLERTAFLHLSDIIDNQLEDITLAESRGAPEEVGIEQLLEEGREVLVQVIKDPLGSKGARLTTQICIPSRYLVFMPKNSTVAVSQKIEDTAERERLREIILCHAFNLLLRKDGSAPAFEPCAAGADHLRDYTGAGGYIVRTAAEGSSEEQLHMDMEFLKRLWRSLQIRLQQAQPPCLIYEDLPLVLRTVRGLVATEVERIRIDAQESYAGVVRFAQQYLPSLVERIEFYTGERPILDLYSIEDEIQKVLRRKVELKSGGYLIIDQTEAMTTIDVNTGGFVGHRNLQETILKTNLDAAQAVARQLRLRNLGGIIIIDFIDMADAEHQRQVLRALEKSFERDHAKVTISKISSLGLVQITRQRNRESIEHILCEPCPTCHGRRSIKTAETVCYEIFREILRGMRQFNAEKFLVLASQPVVDRLLDEESEDVAQLEKLIGCPIKFRVETFYHQEQFDVVLL
ncbi:MAG: Rne/Rng family ribonuclease [Pseudomonadota bacterium]|nr:Rne/Rng family ribonuclease [Pseudomonadota bacterium]